MCRGVATLIKIRSAEVRIGVAHWNIAGCVRHYNFKPREGSFVTYCSSFCAMEIINLVSVNVTTLKRRYKNGARRKLHEVF